MKDIEIHGISIADHVLISLKLQTHTTDKKQNIWRFPAFLRANQAFITYLKEAWDAYSTNNSNHTRTLTLFWEAEKAYLRGKIISYSAAHKKFIHKNFQKTSETLRQAQIAYQMTPHKKRVARC